MHIERKKLKKPVMLLGIIIGLLVLLFVWQYIRREMAQQYSKSSNNQVITVESGRIHADVWHPQISSVGTVKAVQGTNIGAVIDGKVKKIFFVSGEMVTKGQPLVQYDNNDLKAQKDIALAGYQRSKIHYQRVLRVYHTSRAVSKEALDSAAADMQEAKGAYENVLALLQQATLVAPFSGKIGIRQVSLGEFVAKGTAIASLQQINPVYVDFELSESYVSQIKVGDKVQLTNAAYPNHTFTGSITATNSTLNVNTRTLNVRALVANPKHLLIPGMFADVNVIVPIDQQVLTVPEMAVNYSPFGDSVFKIVGNKAQQIYVKVGNQQGDRVAITGKVSAGDRIVTSGVFKLQNGSSIRVVGAPHVTSDKHPDTVPKTMIKRNPVAITPKAKVTETAASPTPTVPSTNLHQHIQAQLRQQEFHAARNKPGIT